MKVYRGTAVKNALIKKESYVSELLSHAASYARYPNNGPGNDMGYIYELEVAESDVDWETREDGCPQGLLKNDVLAKRMTICDIQLDIESRRPPIRIRPDVTDEPIVDGEIVWADGKRIEWTLI